VTSENSPSKVAAADQPFFHFISIEAVVSAESDYRLIGLPQSNTHRRRLTPPFADLDVAAIDPPLAPL
jgi:hypothetical protein